MHLLTAVQYKQLHRGYGYINFQDPKAAEEALNVMNLYDLGTKVCTAVYLLDGTDTDAMHTVFANNQGDFASI